MKNILIFCFTTSLFCISLQNSEAQLLTSNRENLFAKDFRTDSLSLQPTLEKKSKSHFETGISYQNNDVYLGRKDSSVLPYFIPVFSYYHSSGLYLSVSMNYLSSAGASRIDLVTVEGGYTFTSGNYDGEVNFSKFFYNTQSTSVSSEIQGSFGFQNGYDFNAVRTFLNLSLDFGPRMDYTANFGFEHEFDALHEKLHFTPSICMNAGTQNFYDNYYKNKRFSNKGKAHNVGNAVATIEGSIVNPSNFKILDYEASLPISYTIHSLVISFTPSYAIPVNPSLIQVNTKQSNGSSSGQTIQENLTNSFYMTIGFVLKFG